MKKVELLKMPLNGGPRPLPIQVRDVFMNLDPRIFVAGILFIYLVLGLTVLGFNRSPMQAVTTTITCLLFDVLLSRIFRKKWILPLSALITSLSLSFLLNYSHDFVLLFVPVFFAIGSKYLFTVNGKHALNPAMAGVSFSLLLSQELITASPAYQWNGIASMSMFIATLGLMFVIPKVQRTWLVGSFLAMYTLQTALRAWIMQHHLPFETLFLGTLSSPSFFIFTFFMITDPATSPSDRKQQIIVGISLALVDLALHLRQSYYTFFYAALIVAGVRFLWKHWQFARAEGIKNYWLQRFVHSKYYLQPLVLLAVALVGYGAYTKILNPRLHLNDVTWKFEEIDPSRSNLNSFEKGDLLEIADPRVTHISKWILSNGESASTADFDNDGRVDLFLTNLLKTPRDRATLYRNTGNYRFEKFEVFSLREIGLDPKALGIITNAIFTDYDNDGDQDLFLVLAFGHSRLLKNLLIEKKKVEFVDISEDAGITSYTNAIGATFADFNKDGLLDLLILNVWPEFLPNYSTPHRLNLFKLPEPQYAGDDRMFDFMHDSWHMSNNGGLNELYYQTPDHKFKKMDAAKMGLPETRWSLAVGVADLNQDQWPDIYIANDFGPDDLYYNRNGQSFQNIKGTIFGSIGQDTYKGMNVSIADFDQKGWFDVYVSNVHHAFQAEGSLFWSFSPSDKTSEPLIEEKATQKSILNEERFGWGASAADLNNDGWIDLAQANGMVDDTFDKKFESCRDYWYVNEKIARSPPTIHRFANRWGDIRGYCIYGKEQNRIYINRGIAEKPQFIDAAVDLGVTHPGSSRGVISGDFENTGRRDLLFTYPFEAPKFYKNSFIGPQEKRPHWLGFQFTSLNSACNREAIGTRVDLRIFSKGGSMRQVSQEVQTVSGFSSQSDKRLHFGLGKEVEKIQATINWCYGAKTETIENLNLDSYNHLVLE